MSTINNIMTRDVSPVRATFDRERIRRVLRPLASLKLTVTLFALAILLIFFGTLAQVEDDIWQVMEEYFKPWLIWIPAKVLFPSSWFPELTSHTASVWLCGGIAATSLVATLLARANSRSPKRGRLATAGILGIGLPLAAITAYWQGFPFPGGAIIGLLMMVNLVTAHVVRFRSFASGTQLITGIIVTAIGVGLTVAVIVMGHDVDGGLQAEPPFAWTTLWQGLKAVLSAFSAILFVNWWQAKRETTTSRFIARIVGMGSIASGLLSIWLWATGDYIGDSGMRIVWQLTQSLLAGLVLLIGLMFLFRRRAGVVELHLGVFLMMFGQWFVSSYDVEQQITLMEGETRSFAQDIRRVELAVIRTDSDEFPGQDDVVAIPLLVNGIPTHFATEGRIQSELLPFEIQIRELQQNSRVELLTGKPKYDDSQGDAKTWVAIEAPGVSGTEGSGVNLASAYLQLSQDGKPLGTYLVSQEQLSLRDGTPLAFDAERIEVGGQAYDIQLRFQRTYKPYAVSLIDVRRDDYLGTSKPRYYASQIRLTDTAKGIDHEANIWMNNPLRFAGETFYQSNWFQDNFGREGSSLQVVRNRGWMIPYVACMICAVGMTYHFGANLQRFLERLTVRRSVRISLNPFTMLRLVVRRAVTQGIRVRKRNARGKSQTEMQGVELSDLVARIVPVAILVAGVSMIVMTSIPRSVKKGEMDLAEFGTLPLVYQGRVKPVDTLARNSLRLLSEKETFVCRYSPAELKENWARVAKRLVKKWPNLESSLNQLQHDKQFGGSVEDLISFVVERTGEGKQPAERIVEAAASQRQPAIRWLLDSICVPDEARYHKVIRITELSVLETLGVKRRKGYCYSIDEIAPRLGDFTKEVAAARQQKEESGKRLTFYQKKLLELDRKLAYLMLLHRSFTPPTLENRIAQKDFEGGEEAIRAKAKALQNEIASIRQEIKRMEPPLLVPPYGADDASDVELPQPQWEAYAAAWPLQTIIESFGRDPNPAFQSINRAFIAYGSYDAKSFNKEVRSYHQLLEKRPPAELVAKATWTHSLVSAAFGNFYRFESFFNSAAPFFWSAWLYLSAFVLLAVGWLRWSEVMRRSAYGLMWLTFGLHTVALIARMYISGRPPVTNLYSSAVFIGWGGVLLTLLSELFYRRGLFSVVAAAMGFATLWIAHLLAGEGDTMEVLQAVLDTQFWLATHVVCITLGYATTFVAGLLGVMYVVKGIFTPSLDAEEQKELSRMTYGSLCFAILFSFIGTILGGLWADDSWGRFWGWDPKENGALIIVLWNALILHARWDGLIRERGLAVLSIAGNMVTAWSWFGVNELGVGLHSYGFTEGRLFTLSVFCLINIALILIGSLPLRLWWSMRAVEPVESSSG
jgi:ABC-type transport system involved in cytochrome c biogenesis permease subunit